MYNLYLLIQNFFCPRISRRALISKERSPGPAQYGATDQNTYKHKLPKYTMGIQLEGLKDKINSPGPAGYPRPEYKSCMGGYSFGRRVNKTPYITADDTLPCSKYS